MPPSLHLRWLRAKASRPPPLFRAYRVDPVNVPRRLEVSQFEIFTVVRPVNVAAAGFAQGFSNFQRAGLNGCSVRFNLPVAVVGLLHDR